MKIICVMIVLFLLTLETNAQSLKNTSDMPDVIVIEEE